MGLFQATGGLFMGATERYLALICAAEGDAAAAEHWFAAAQDAHARIGSPPWLARTAVDWAE